MNILALPTEILLNVLKDCHVSDICQINLTCRAFNALAKDQPLWQGFCQRAMPNMEFRDVGTDFSFIYRHQVRKYTKLLGIWVSKHKSFLVVAPCDGGLYGFYFRDEFWALRLGEVPKVNELLDALAVQWDPSNQEWGTPLCLFTHHLPGTGSYVPVQLEMERDGLNLKHILDPLEHPSRLYCLNERYPTRFPMVSSAAVPPLQNILPPGLFVKSVELNTMDAPCSIVKVAYQQGYLTIKKLVEVAGSALGETRVSLTAPIDLEAARSDHISPACVSHVKEMSCLDLTEKSLPPRFIREFLQNEDVTNLPATYRVALGCVLQCAYRRRESPRGFPGFCIVFNDDLLCVVTTFRRGS